MVHRKNAALAIQQERLPTNSTFATGTTALMPSLNVRCGCRNVAPSCLWRSLANGSLRAGRWRLRRPNASCELWPFARADIFDLSRRRQRCLRHQGTVPFGHSQHRGGPPASDNTNGRRHYQRKITMPAPVRSAETSLAWPCHRTPQRPGRRSGSKPPRGAWARHKYRCPTSCSSPRHYPPDRQRCRSASAVLRPHSRREAKFDRRS